MNQSIQKVIRFICLFIGGIFLINTSVALAENNAKDNVYDLIWEGTIRIEIKGDGNQNDKPGTTSYNRNRNIDGSVLLKICGYSTDLVVKEINWHYRYTDNLDEKSEKDKTACSDPVTKKNAL